MKATEHNAAAYAWMIPYLQTVSRELGYAIGIHGSLARDLDIIAVPWTEEAVAAEILVEAFRKAVGGTVLPDGTMGGRWDKEKNEFVECKIEMPGKKPHGRLAWNIHLTGGIYIDLSVMPRILK